MVRGQGVKEGDQYEDENDEYTKEAKEEAINEYNGRPRKNRSRRRRGGGK